MLGTGCSVTRKLDDEQALVRKITINGIDQQFVENAASYVDKQQQPNNLLNLQFYYLFSKNGKRDIGEPPAILDSNLVEFSRGQIEQYLHNKGFLKAAVASDIKVKKKRAELIFNIKRGPVFRVRKFTDSIGDPAVADLYHRNQQKFTHIIAGKRFDSDSLAYEREQIYQLLKRNGYYDYLRQYVTFSVDSNLNNSVVDVRMLLDNPDGKKGHTVYDINNTIVTISPSAGRERGNPDTLRVDSDILFVDYSQKFKPKAVSIYLFQHKGNKYSLDQQNLSTSRLSELNVFRNVPNPTYTKRDSNTLDVNIDLIPQKRMSNSLQGEFIFNSGRYGFNAGTTYTNRNLFGRAEILEAKVNGSLLLDAGRGSASRIQNQEFKAGVSLSYPRIIAPFNLPILGKYGVPHTTFSTNYQRFYQQNLVTRQSFINSMTYDFRETSSKIHRLTPIYIEYSKGIIDTAAQRALIQQNNLAYLQLIGRTVYTAGSQYNYTVGFNRLNTLANFKYFSGTLELGGGTLNLLSRAFGGKAVDGTGVERRTLFGEIFAQYVKGEADFRIYRHLGGERQFIVRFNPGVAVPYGNSDDLIFEKYFYVGGANDNRAWLPRTLGPGKLNRALYPSDTIRTVTRYLDQFGEVKFVGNLEYRYNIVPNFFGSKLNGATFIDYGNVWRMGKYADTTYGDTRFRLGNLLSSTAVGIGTGIRVDVSFFVFRLDVGLKLKDPQFTGGDQFVLGKWGNKAFKQQYFDQNNERYRFYQLNFGIGMPF